MGRLQPLRLYAGKEGRLRESRSGMSETASSLTELSAKASPIAEAAASEPDAVEYPEGRWTAPSVWHGDAVRLATAALHHHFRDRDDVLVAMELVVYYLRGDNRAWLQPDVQVVFGVGDGGNRNLRTYKVWEEGKAPDFVLEVASPSTAENDARYKAQEYLGIGVREYWRLDPEGTMMGTPLEGYRAKGGRYDRVESVEHPGGVGYQRSRVLGLDLRGERRTGATVLVIRDPRTGRESDGALEASERQRRMAEDRASATEDELDAASDEVNAARNELSAARDRASTAEERVRELEQRLRDLTGQIRPMGRDSQG